MGINSPNPTPTADPNQNPTSASLSLNIRMLFSAANPNKVGIKYGESSFTVMYRGIPLGKASIPGFYQDAHTVRQVVATIAVDRVNLLQADAADLVRDASLNDRVELRVLGDVGAKIRVLNFDSPGVQVGNFSLNSKFSRYPNAILLPRLKPSSQSSLKSCLATKKITELTEKPTIFCLSHSLCFFNPVLLKFYFSKASNFLICL
ncbi:hypothetical protein C1H46_035367 [Malus baccata]|uniref:Late embryogenesis abundant protein LEA-2 subgroup domain-containing protein n=1 Tax=Malus baccata TaxID=106549 RepID=A0A540KYD4_MALBA|nr:hypothetical protein C1H46_035367 [Malus baccata]